jgi:hypothetical protein
VSRNTVVAEKEEEKIALTRNHNTVILMRDSGVKQCVRGYKEQSHQGTALNEPRAHRSSQTMSGT